jgi:hypothetical protein
MKKINNKTLGIVLSTLLLIFLVTKVFRSPARKSNLNNDLFRLDTAKITEINLFPKIDSLTEIKLMRKENGWNAIHKEVEAKIPREKIKRVLTTLSELRPERVMTRKKENWKEYQVNDSATTAVNVFAGNDEVLQLKVGKSTSGGTYARVSNSNEVYVLEGDLQSVFNKPFSDWRNHTFLRLTKNEIEKIEFNYSGDGSFILEKQDKKWMIANQPADSAAIETYLNKVYYRDQAVFADHFSPLQSPDASVVFHSKANGEITINGWKNSSHQWILYSSMQPGTYFSDEGAALANNLFGRKQLFTANRQIR